MRYTLKSTILGALLLLTASTGASAYHGGYNVVRPLHGFSSGYGYPAIHRYTYHYMPRHFYGSHYGHRSWRYRPYSHSYYGRYNEHRPYYDRHPFARPYGRGSSLFFRYYDW
jgi:hypothetical protein